MITPSEIYGVIFIVAALVLTWLVDALNEDLTHLGQKESKWSVCRTYS